MRRIPCLPLAEDEKKPFQITPFVFYLTRQVEKLDGLGAGAGKLEIAPNP